MTAGDRRSGAKCRTVVALLLMTAIPAAAQYQSENVDLLSRVALSEFGAEFAEDSWGYVSPSGREYAIIGLSNGTGFVEITDPAPRRRLALPQGLCTARSIWDLSVGERSGAREFPG